MRKFLATIGILALLIPGVALGARTDALWDYNSGGNDIYPNANSNGVNILVKGLSKYLNFNSVVGVSGYGIRDNGGVMEFKNSAGAWAGIGTGGSGGTGTVTSVDVSGGTTGLTTSGGPVTVSGTITLAGTLGVANGGTGNTTGPFSTTSVDYYKSVNNFFSTTSASFFSSVGLAFSTTSTDYWLTTKSLGGFSTTSANFWASVGLAFSTTSSDYHFSTKSTSNLAEGTNLYYTAARDVQFSTSSANFWSTFGLGFSTTSTNYWLTTKNTDNLSEGSTNLYYTAARDIRFSTTSASYFSSFGLAFSTTSTDYWKTQNNFFSTTSTSYFASVGLAHSTTSVDYQLSTKGYLTSNQSISLTGDVTGSGATSIPTSIVMTVAHWWTALQNTTNASTSQLTATSSVWLTSLGTPAGTVLAVDPTGKIIATSTAAGGVTAVTATAPAYSTGGATPNITVFTISTSSNANSGELAQFTSASAVKSVATSTLFNIASSLVSGLLSAADWTTFNAKENALTFVGPLFRSGNSISWFGLSTTTQPASSNLLVSNGSNGVYGVATTSGTVSTPLTGSLSCIGPCSLGIQAGGSGQNGYISSTDWNAFNARLSSSTVSLIDHGQFFSTTSNSYFASVGLAFSTTSADYNQSTKGYLTSINGTYPVQTSGNTVSLAFGTTTANTWSLLQTLTSGLTSNGNVTIRTGNSAIFKNGNNNGDAYIFNNGGSGANALTLTNFGASQIAVNDNSLSFTGPSTFFGLTAMGNATTSQITATSSVWLTSLGTPAGTVLAVDPTGKIIATSTAAGGVTSVTASGQVYSTGGATPNITWFGISTSSNTNTGELAQFTSASGVKSVATSTLFNTANALVSGLLSSADWSTFNGKENVLTFIPPLFRAANSISWFGLSTTTQPASSNILVSNGSNGVYGAATTSGTVSTPLTGSLTCIGSCSLGIQAGGATQNGYISSTDWNAFNARLSTSSLALIDHGQFFSTTSDTFFASVGLAFSTTSDSFFASVGLAFSTTSSNYWQTTKSTTNLAEGTNLYYTAARDIQFSTTSADYLQTQRNYFSTTSASYFSSLGLAHSTTSVAYQLTQPTILGNSTSTTFFATTASTTNLFGTSINGFGLTTCNGSNFLQWSSGVFACGTPAGSSGFSTTSANYWASVGLAHSTTSSAYFLSQNQGAAFSTTSANAWSVFGLGHSTTSVAYQLTQNTTLGNSTSTTFFSAVASTTNLFGTSINGFGLTTCTGASKALTWSGGVFGCNTITSGAASTTLLSDINTFSGNRNSFTNSLDITGSGTNDTLRITSTSAVSGGLYFQNTQAAAQAVMYVDNNRGSFASYGGLLQGGSTNAIGNIFGVSRADRTFLFADGASSLGMGIGTLTAQPLIFGTNNTEFARLTSAGNFGIGTSSPEKLLMVEGAQAGGIMRVQRDVAAAANTAYGTYDVALNETGGLQNGTGPTQTFSTRNNGGTLNTMADISAFRAGADTTGSLQFRAYNTGSAVASTLVLDGINGILSFGTTTPSIFLCSDTLIFCQQNSAHAANVLIASTSATAMVRTTFGSNAFIGSGDPAQSRGEAGTLSNHPFAFFTNNIVRATLSATGFFGIGSTTPWANLSVTSTKSTIADYNTPVFVMATSSDAFGFLTGLWATTSVMVSGQNPRGFVLDSGARFAIGTTQTYDYPGLLDQLTVNGRISTGDWVTETCNGVMNNGASGITTPANAICGQWGFRVDTNGSLSPTSNVNSNGGIGKMRMCASVTNTGSCSPGLVSDVSGSGAGIFYPNAFNNFLSFATTTPVFEAIFSHGSETATGATSTSMYLGFLNTSPPGSSFEVEPTAGCYIAATSTTGANWQAICRTSAGAVTTVDTGFASTTLAVGATGDGTAVRLRIEGDNTSARFYMASAAVPMRMVAKITTNLPTAMSSNITAGAIIVNTAANTAGHNLWIHRIKVTYFQPSLNY